ncbi:hypothetical protein K1719_034322 [Acacia pycnantha]|nr:hypothetical protein K1719_034322 [Acacia pycnantha]
MGSSSLPLKLTLLAAYTLAATVAVAARRDCNSKCGNLDISYPFGTKKGCFQDPDFQIKCLRDASSGRLVPYLATKTNGDIEVLNISWNTSEIQVSMPPYRVCYDPKEGYNMGRDAFWVPPKFGISNKKNKFNVVGCSSYAFLYDRKGNGLQGCDSRCDGKSSPPKNYDGSCQNDLVQAVSNYTITILFYRKSESSKDRRRCSYAFLAQNGSFNSDDRNDVMKLKESNRSTVVLDWAVDDMNKCGGACKSQKSKCIKSESASGYYCTCKPGFEGNPYTEDGCKDVDECHNSTKNICLYQSLCHNTYGSYYCSCPHGQIGDGRNQTGQGSGCSIPDQIRVIIIPLVVTIALLAVFALVSILCWAHKRKTVKQLRLKNFEQNGGNLLLQQLSQQGYTDRTRIFTEVELKNATNHFEERGILGHGGQATVYKGLLPDNTPVAIKKSRVGADPQNVKNFINEVIVLSQINHRHVVKLLGCCLETEVPLLVYEFIDNGTLLAHLHPSKNECFITWETRLRIATETAEAISYLHSAASIPIIHRDIKSANILLDHNDRAKGTIGYLDPEYLQTGQLNEKSDVYSFGIVLVELLTGMKAFESKNSLAETFVSSMGEDHLWEILDKRVLDQKKNAIQLKEVALLARRCIRVNGEERPTMKEVAMELEGLMAMEKHLQEKDKDMMVEESEHLLGRCPNNDGYGSTGASFSVASSYDSIQKHVTFEFIDGGR